MDDVLSYLQNTKLNFPQNILYYQKIYPKIAINPDFHNRKLEKTSLIR